MNTAFKSPILQKTTGEREQNAPSPLPVLYIDLFRFQNQIPPQATAASTAKIAMIPAPPPPMPAPQSLPVAVSFPLLSAVRLGVDGQAVAAVYLNAGPGGQLAAVRQNEVDIAADGNATYIPCTLDNIPAIGKGNITGR